MRISLHYLIEAHNGMVRAVVCRYFVIPFLIAQIANSDSKPRFHSQMLLLQVSACNSSCSLDALPAQIVLFVAVNVVTFYLFLARPFVGPDGAEARFMW